MQKSSCLQRKISTGQNAATDGGMLENYSQAMAELRMGAHSKRKLTGECRGFIA